MEYGIIGSQKPPILENHLHLGGRNDREDIRVNSRYFVRNGLPWIPVMGEIHYARIREEEWERELLKMKAGGITTVSCYVIWIYHEEKEGVFDFSGSRNLRKFIKTAEACGLKLVLRIGPWVHGEVRNGGFPDWLLEKGCDLRKDDPIYLSFVERFFCQIRKQTEGCLFYENGPVWAIQLENELTDQGEHLLTLRHLAEKTGLKVPIYTVTGWNAQYGAQIPEYDVVPVFGGYPEAPWETHKEKLEPGSHYFFLPFRNDSGIGKDLMNIADDSEDVFRMNYDLYPFATCELGGGIQITHHRRPVMGRDDVAALSLVKLGSGNNLPGYYMYHGGTNDISETTLQESKATGYPNDYPIRNYDFQAPIGEYGQVRDSYRQLKKQNLFIKSFMEKLAPMDAFFQEKTIASRKDRQEFRYSVRTDGNAGFVFVNNFQRQDVLAEHDDVQFRVPCGKSEMTFPEKGMKIPSGTYGILPYNLPVGSLLLEYATAQPLYCKDDTWFFFAPFGAEAEYCFRKPDGEKKIISGIAGSTHAFIVEGDGKEVLRIVTLSPKEAEQFYVLEDDAYVTEGSELYRKENRIVSYRKGNPQLSFSRWEKDRFVKREILLKEKEIPLEIKEFTPKLSDYLYSDELFLDGEKRTVGYALELPDVSDSDMEDAFLEIMYTGDVLQIYVNGVLAADDFGKGIPFEVSISHLRTFGTKAEIIISELKEGCCYMEKGKKSGLSLEKIRCLPLWFSSLYPERR